MDPDSDQDCDGKEMNPLIVPLNEDYRPTQEQLVERWFSQDVFAEVAEERVLEESSSEDEVELPKIAKKAEDPRIRPKDRSTLQCQKANQQEDFEIVPNEEVMDGSDDSSSDEESSEEEDIDTKAEILAYAKKMLRKKQREQIIDDSYNKYMYDDVGLPKWFVEDEKRHCRRQKPVTKEEIAAMKAQLREIDARPAKKVAEAKARKKRAAMRKLEKARKKADSISDQTDISERSKRKMIDHLYKKAMPTRPKKEYVVAKKGVPVKGGKGKVVVDRRMKKDKRTKGLGRLGRGGRAVKDGKPKGKAWRKKGGKGGKKGNKAGMKD